MSRTEVVINTTGMTFEDVLAVARHDAKIIIAPATASTSSNVIPVVLMTTSVRLMRDLLL